MSEFASSYDYIIVGGGTAGCVVASRLSDNPSTRVLLLEAGERDSSPWFSVPAASFKVSADPLFGWGYLTESQDGLNGRQIPLIQARVLGGGSSINGMVYTRGAASTFNAWRSMGCDGWGYEEVVPYFRRSQASDRGAGPLHGATGFMKTVRGHSDLPITAHMLAGFAESGFPIVDDLNVPSPEGIGYYDWCVADGRRASMPAVLPGLRKDRSNLTVGTRATATRVVIEKQRASAVEVVWRGSRSSIRAEREIVLCAGAIGSAKLLLLSGIGPAESLQRLGVPVVVDHPEVGKNLQNHVAYRLEFLCSHPVTARRYVHPWRGSIEGLRYLWGRKGFLSSGAAPIGGFFRSSESSPEPDVQLFAIPALLGQGRGFLGMLPSVHGYTLCLNQGSPFSRGSVTLRSADPTEAPAVDPQYLSDSRDLEIMVLAAERLRAVASAPSLARYTEREILPGPAVQSRADWAAHIRSFAFNHFHVCGTCRMGRSSADSVTDHQLRVHGLRGLRVADAAVMPLLMNGNTGAAVIMIAERAAEALAATSSA